MAMLTVHKLPTTHLILAENDIAKQARETGIEEVLVIIDRGDIVHVHTPPCEGDEFTSDDDWIFTMARDLYQRGLDPGPRSSLGVPEMVAPAGWTLWADLKPGTIATSGDPDPDTGHLLAVGGPGYFETNGGMLCNACYFARDRSAMPREFKAERPPALWPFFKVLAEGLTRGTMHSVIEAVEAGEPIETALQGAGRLAEAT